MIENEQAQPLHNLDAERALLGSILFLDDAIEEISQTVSAKMFYCDVHGKIFSAIEDLHRNGCRGIDSVTLAEELLRRGQLGEVGGAAYIGRIVEEVPHAAHARHYAGIVVEKYRRRELIQQFEILVSESHRPGSNLTDLTENAIRSLQDSSLGIAGDGRQRAFQGKSVGEIWDLGDKPVSWLVDGVFSCDQPTIIGAKQKSLKTTLLTDLAVSLASGLTWLGRFAVPQKRRVLFITGEASEQAAIRKVRKAASSRNLRREDMEGWLRIEAMTFPNLPSLADCSSIRSSVRAHGIEVVIVDPLYMGLQGLNTTNLNEVGPAMRQFMEYCRPANVIIAHHVKKTASYEDAPNLEDLSQAGIAEFAGNYWLMGRMGEYTGDKFHQLAIRYGGRDEQFGLLKLDFDETDWTSHFTSLVDHRQDVKVRKGAKDFDDRLTSIKSHLQGNAGEASLAKVAEVARTKPERALFQKLIEALCGSGQYERCQMKSGNNRPCDGLRAKGQVSPETVR